MRPCRVRRAPHLTFASPRGIWGESVCLLGIARAQHPAPRMTVNMDKAYSPDPLWVRFRWWVATACGGKSALPSRRFVIGEIEGMAADTRHIQQAEGTAAEEEVIDKVLTLPNIVSFVRLLMVPAYLALLLSGFDIAATAVFAVAAATDFVDGQLARRTHTVSKLGQLLDPAVDRILMITGVLGVFLVGRLPLWVIVVVLARDLLMLVGGGWLLSRYRIRVPVVYAGKVATTFLFAGFAGLLLNWPLVPGLGVCDAAWLPGFTNTAVSWGIWFVYAGLILAIGTTVYYCVAALGKLRAAKAQDKE